MAPSWWCRELFLSSAWLDALELRTESGAAFAVTAVYSSGCYDPLLLARQLHQGLSMPGAWSTARLHLGRQLGSRLSDEEETQLMRAHHGQPSQPAALLVTMDTAIQWLTDLALLDAAQQLSTFKIGSQRVAAAAQRQQQHSQPQHSQHSQQLPPIPGPSAATLTQPQQQPVVHSQPAPRLQPGWLAAVRRASCALIVHGNESCPFLHRLALASACL